MTEWLEAGLAPNHPIQLAGRSRLETTLKLYAATRPALLEPARLASDGCLEKEQAVTQRKITT
jgi:hypothetical protein